MVAAASAPVSHPPCALVIGLCSHGLAIARSLHANGIEVFAFEANPDIPGFRTRSAVVQQVPSIKNHSLIEQLHRFRKEVSAEREIVLFPTNDNNVRIIAENIDRLRGQFLLSWENCAPSIESLLLKSNIEARCRETQLLYPRSVIVDDPLTLASLISDLATPLIVKPVNPQSGFKALKFPNAHSLELGMKNFPDDFPVIIQEWIPGTAEDIYFCALYLDQGRVAGHFVGRKLESHPPALGQTTVAITHQDPRLVELTERFFDGLTLSGPVSLELKKDYRGNYWVIEPTIGRSDFWLGLCVKSGFDLPMLEFQCTSAKGASSINIAPRNTIWFDSERDITAPLRYLYKWFNFSRERFQTAFSYYDPKDLSPFYLSLARLRQRVTQSIHERYLQAKKKDASVVTPKRNSLNISCFESFESLPQKFEKLVQQYGDDYLFYDPKWFKNFCEHVAEPTGSIRILCLTDTDGEALAVLPLWLHLEIFHGIKVRKLSSLANYYTPRFDLFIDQNRTSRKEAGQSFFDYISDNFKNWDVVELHPMFRECIDEIRTARKISFPYYMTENYVQPIRTDYAGYLKSRPSRHKNTIRRKMRKLASLDNFEFDISEGDSHIDDVMAHYHGVYLKSWKIDEPFPKFIDGLVRLASSEGWLRLGRLLIDGQVVASQIWLVANDTAYIYKLAYDRKFADLSPGTLLTCEILKHVIDNDGVKYIDFLNGSDAFKKDWMDSSSSLYGIQFPNVRSGKGLLLVIVNYFSNWKEKWLKQRDWFEPGKSARNTKVLRRPSDTEQDINQVRAT